MTRTTGHRAMGLRSVARYRPVWRPPKHA